MVLFVHKVIHAHGNYAHGPWHQFLGMAALAAVPLHVVHRSVEALSEPFVQTAFGKLEVNVADAGLLETEFTAPVDDLCLESRHIGIAVLVALLVNVRSEVVFEAGSV